MSVNFKICLPIVFQLLISSFTSNNILNVHLKSSKFEERCIDNNNLSQNRKYTLFVNKNILRVVRSTINVIMLIPYVYVISMEYSIEFRSCAYEDQCKTSER